MNNAEYRLRLHRPTQAGRGRQRLPRRRLHDRAHAAIRAVTRRLLWLARLAGIAAAALSCGCGGGDVGDGFGEIEPPLLAGTLLPNDSTAPHAYAEHTLAAQPLARLRLEHLAVLWTDAGDAAADPGDTGAAGSDSVVYRLETPTALTLAIDDSADSVEQLMLSDQQHRQLLRVVHGAPPAPLPLEPGVYRLDVQYRAGAAAGSALFLKPGFAPDGVGAVLLASGDCFECDFTSTDLSGRNLDDLDLSGSKFGNAKLAHTSWAGTVCFYCKFWAYVASIYPPGRYAEYKTDISGVDFRGAFLDGAQFDGVSGVGPLFADVEGTTWGAVRIAAGQEAAFRVTISGASFFEAFMPGADLRGASITNSDFRGAVLVGAKLSSPGPFAVGPWITSNRADFSGSKFGPSPQRATDLRGADLTNTDLSGLDFSGAQFQPDTIYGVTVMAGAILRGANLRVSNLSGAVLEEAVFAGADLRGADLSNTRASGASFDGANLEGASLYNAFLASSGTGQIIPAATARRAQLKNANLSFAHLSGVDFELANLYGTNPSAASPCTTTADNHAGFTKGCAAAHGAAITGSNFAGAYLYGADFSGATIVGSNFEQAVLIGASFSGASLSASPETGVRTSLANALVQGANLQAASFSQVDLSGAFVDFSAGGGLIYVLLDGASHNAFTGCPASSPDGSAPNCGLDVCVLVEYDAATQVPLNTSGSVCPDGSQQGCAAAVIDGSNPRWRSTFDAGNPPAGVPPAWYGQDATYTPMAPAAAICRGGMGGNGIVDW